MCAKNQLTLQDAQRLFDYRDGKLYWKHVSSGQRRDRMAGGIKKRRGHQLYLIKIGSVEYQAHYLIWNFHHGITRKAVRPCDGDFLNLRIENLHLVEPYDGNFIRVQLRSLRISCPCCQQRVTSPTLEVIVLRFGLAPLEAKVLSAVWSAKGLPVSTEKVFAEMYSDDPDGGPSNSKMYSAFKVALSRLRAKIRGSGVSIENVGYGQGYRLILGD